MKNILKRIPILLTLSILLSYSGYIYSQDDTTLTVNYGQGKDSGSWAIFQGLKINFIQENLELTDEEKDGFWPLFHEYEREKKEIMSNIMGGGPPGKGHHRHFDRLTDEQIDSLINQRFVEEQDLLNLKIKYYVMLKEVLPAKKIANYYKIDEDFRRHLIERMKGKKAEGERGSREGR